jgi:hypothetical protein
MGVACRRSLRARDDHLEFHDCLPAKRPMRPAMDANGVSVGRRAFGRGSLRELRAGLMVVSMALGVGCRASQDRTDGPPKDAEQEAPADATQAFVDGKSLRLAAPLTAVRTSSLAAVAGRDRRNGQVVLAYSFDDSWTSERTLRVGESGAVVADDIEVFGSQDKVALAVRGLSAKGSAKRLYRVDLGVDAGRQLSSPVDAGEASCATDDGVFSLYRDADALRSKFRPFVGTDPEIEGLVGPAKSEATLVCARHRVFLAATVQDTSRVFVWARGEKPVSPVVVPKVAGNSGESETSMAGLEDGLVAVKLDENGTVFVWKCKGDKSPSAWTRASLGEKGEAGLEAIVPSAGMLGIVLTRSVDPGKSCKDTDALDTVAEVAIVDDTTGRVLHPPERVETWRCGAEPGPFFTGWVDGQLVVAWPRGADAACARAGVRFGGISYAIVGPKAGRARLGRAGRPAEAVADAGCVGTKCYVAALTRGPDPCAAADSPAAGTLEMFSLP